MITIDDFRKIELKTGKIISVENHSNADKLYVLKVDIGGEIRQIVAGLKPYLKPEELLNKNVAVVVNLQPAILRGVESQGMVLAASAEGLVTILTPDKEVPPGSRVS
ncbi:MAG: methionine--tRNA ligase subunit beta [Planctomycetes bacterium]|nr:methionine--tRNA ligase subunit beta [Planctomycetota bacterium]